MTRFSIPILAIAFFLLAQEPHAQDKALDAKAVVGVYSRVYFDRANKPVPTADLEFTADGNVLERGLRTAKWAVKGNAVVMVIDDERFGTATLKPEGENRLVGVNTHKDGNEFRWVLTRNAEVAQEPKAEPGKKEEKPLAKQGEQKASSPNIVTAAYYPHVPGTVLYFDTVAKLRADGNNFAHLGFRSKVVHEKDGMMRSTTFKKGFLSGQERFNPNDDTWLKDVKEPASTLLHRQTADFIEIGARLGGKDIEWEPVLKLGAKEGDSWKWKDFVCTLTFATTSSGLPSAAVEITKSFPNGDKSTSTKHYVKGIGLVEIVGTEMTKDGTVKGAANVKCVTDGNFVMLAIRNGYANITISDRERVRLLHELRHGLPDTLTEADAPGLIKVIEAKDGNVQAFAIGALGNIGADSPAALAILTDKATAFYAKEALSKISEITQYRKHASGRDEELDPLVRILLKGTSDHYKDVGFKKYAFGMTHKEVADLAPIGMPRSLPWSVGLVFPRYDRDRTGREGWLGGDQSDLFYFIDGKLAGFNKKYRDDVQGLIATITALSENLLAYATSFTMR